jgi:hypothetical protein
MHRLLRVILLPLIVAASTAAPAADDVADLNKGPLAGALQLWLRADDLQQPDGAAVAFWPDRSGHGRDLAATKDHAPGGVGLPAKFVKESSLHHHPAVRFDPATGLASAPADPVAIRGDGELTIVLVMNLEPNEGQDPVDGIVGLGNPANTPGDPGKPMAALVAVHRGQGHALLLAGGWNHDASMGDASYKPLYGKPVVVTITKQPGPMRIATRFYIDGELQSPTGSSQQSADSTPAIQHRADIGVYMGRALGWAGSFRGDVGELLIYNKVLTEPERVKIEGDLASRFSIALKAPPAPIHLKFTDAEKKFWAYQPVRDPAPPAVKNAAWVKSPIDRFILARLESQGLSPAPPADKRTLLRRVTFDLTGLPPTPEAIDAFLGDASPQAFEHVVDRLLASPRYGEQWGRHWFDLVRYADTTANDANAVMRYAWRYRNYVIDALNRDLPYDQFVTEQLAGDLLPPGEDVAARNQRIIATGFLMIGPKALAETDKEQTRLDIVDDQLDVISRALLGLTVTCARCHDHKFDAIRAADYYALAGILRSTEHFQNEDRNASMWWEFPLNDAAGKPAMTVMAPKETTARNLPIHLRGNRFTLGQTVPRGFPQIITPDAPTIAPGASGRLELARWIASPTNPLTARVMVNRVWQGHFGRGIVPSSDNFGMRGDRPSHPELLDWLATRFVQGGWSLKAMHRTILLSSTYQQQCRPTDSAAGADPDNRLLSFFPRRRLSAEELRDSVLQISGKLDLTPGGDESSEMLWKKAESDNKTNVRPNLLTADDPYYTTYTRRSVYLPIVRNMAPDVLALFDGADANSVVAVRNDTTVPSQSLFLLNSKFMREQARQFAQLLLDDEKLDDEKRLTRAHLLVTGRPPLRQEFAEARAFLDAYLAAPAVQSRPEPERRLSAWQSYCQALFCQNDFLYRD